MSATPMPFPDRDTVCDKLSKLTGEDQSYFELMFQNAAQDENFLAGLHLFLDRQSQARFLNSLKLGQLGEWVGDKAPARMQIRLAEIGRSSQHPAFAAFRDGVTRSGGFERAYPKANV